MLRRSFSALPDRFPAALPATTVGFPSTRKGIDNLPVLRYVSSHKKRWSKDPIRLTTEVIMKNVTKMLVVLSMLVAGTAANAAIIFDNGITANNGFISDPDFAGTPK